MKLIGIAGLIGSGKDTAAGMIQEHTGRSWEIKKYAEKLKLMIALALGVPRERLEDREFKDKWCYNITTGELRHMDAILREHQDALERGEHRDLAIHEEVAPVYLEGAWITIRVLMQDFGTEGVRARFPRFWVNSLFADLHTASCWLVTDVRFPNEGDAIRARGGLVVRVENPRAVRTGHTSETAMDGYAYDYTIHNNGSLADLSGVVSHMLHHFNLHS